MKKCMNGANEKNRKKSGKKIKGREITEAVLFAAPALFFVILVVYIPFAMNAAYSLTEWNSITQEAEYIGFRNFIGILSGQYADFRNSVVFTCKYAVLYTVLSNVAALFLAACFVRHKRSRLMKVICICFVLPSVINAVSAGFFWKYIFTDVFGRLADLTGWVIWKWHYLESPRLAPYTVVCVGVWQSLGIYIVMYMAGLRAVPAEFREAARIDGASHRKCFFRVVLPQMQPCIALASLISMVRGLKVFDIIMALTEGGPYTTTYSLTMQILNEALRNSRYGVAAAESVVYFILILAVILLMHGCYCRWDNERNF